MASQYVNLPLEGGGSGAGVSSLNSLTGALSIVAGSGISVTPSGSTITVAATGGGGTVTSVALSDATGIFNISGSPVTTSGTLSLASLKSQSQNTFLAAPNGSAGAPTFRLIVAADVPTLNQNTTGTAANVTATSNSTLVTLSALSLPYSQITGAPAAGITQLTGDATAGPGSGSQALTFATVNANVGSFGSASSVATFTVNAKGLLTAAASVSISLPTTQLTGVLQAAQSPAHTGDVTSSAGSLALALVATTNSTLTTLSALSLPYSQVTGGPSTNAITALTGDGTASGPGSSAFTLATVNSNVGSFGSASSVATFTVNGKGLITSAASTSIAISGSAVSGGTFGAVNGSALTNLSAANLSGVLPIGVTGGSGLSIATTQLTGNISLTAQVSGILPIANGGTAVSSVTTAPAATAWAGWDANKNMTANSMISQLTSTATAAGTTTLTVSSTYNQLFTGSSAQTCVLPVATTMANGQGFQVVNTSTGLVTVQTSGGVILSSLPTNSVLEIVCINTAGGTGSASWAYDYNSNTATAWAFGAGTDGAATITANNTTTGTWLSSGVLQRDVFLTNLTISGSGAIKGGGYRIFVSGILDLTGASAAAIQVNGGNGGNGGASITAGAAGALGGAVNNIPGGLAGKIGGVGATGAGVEGAAAGANNAGQGGQGGPGAKGGTGSSAAGGALRANLADTYMNFARFGIDLIAGVTQYGAGGGAPGGSGGGGDSTVAGGGGGGGGGGAGCLWIAANFIKTSGAAAGSIQATGGNGGTGGTPVSGTAGGGSGGPGGGGGWIYLIYGTKLDAAATNVLDASGGTGGAGGNGTNSGVSGGGGAGGGAGGTITLFDMTNGVGSETHGGVPVTGNVATNATGGASIAGQSTKVNF